MKFLMGVATAAALAFSGNVMANSAKKPIHFKTKDACEKAGLVWNATGKGKCTDPHATNKTAPTTTGSKAGTTGTPEGASEGAAPEAVPAE